MGWEKLGRIFCPDHTFAWMVSHAANPVPAGVCGDLLHIYFNCRDANQRSHVAAVTVDLNRPGEVLDLSRDPLLAPGRIGTFDDSGVSLGCLVEADGDVRLYYMGWNLGVTVPWRNSIGLACLNPSSGGFERHSEAPVLDRHALDLYSLSYPFVMKDGPRWRMWYGSNLTWGRLEKDMLHVIKYAESADGIEWRRDGHIAVAVVPGQDYAITRPSVVKQNGRYRMWYCFRGEAYRIGYAESEDGHAWRRMDSEAGIGVSESGWDSEMVCYPYVFEHQGQLLMLYCGNGYGRSGMGLARYRSA